MDASACKHVRQKPVTELHVAQPVPKHDTHDAESGVGTKFASQAHVDELATTEALPCTHDSQKPETALHAEQPTPKQDTHDAESGVGTKFASHEHADVLDTTEASA
jgi:hypothetical protein